MFQRNFIMLKKITYLKKFTSIVVFLLTVTNSPFIYAVDRDGDLSGEQETPDPLFQSASSEDKAKQAGDDKIYLKHRDAKKIDTQITPDLLEQSLNQEEDDNADTTLQEIIETVRSPKLSKKELERQKRLDAAERLQIPPDLNAKPKFSKKSLESENYRKEPYNKRDELITPDPLLESM